MKITLEELQAFLAVVDSGSLTAAAQQLGQTVSAASRALGRLEEKLQTTLMHRTTRRIELTEEGRAFLVQARAIIEAVEGAEEAMAVRRGQPSGRLRVDAATPFMLHVIVPLIQAIANAIRRWSWSSTAANISSICWSGAPTWPSASAT